MKIVIDARESGTTSGRYVDKLLEYLQKIDSSNTYIFLLKKHRLQNYQNMPSNFHAVECNVKEFTFSEQTKLCLQLYRLRADVVHFPMVQQPLLYFGRTVTTMQDLTTLRFHNPAKNLFIFWIKQRIYWLVNFIVPRKSKKVIAISEYTKKDVMNTMRYNNSRKFTVTLESAEPLSDSSIHYKPLVNKQFIMYVGRHQPHKNLPRLIEAHQKLVNDNPDLLLVIVGKKDATTELLEREIKSKNYKNIVITGFVSDAELRWLYEHTACYVFPSLSEGFGLPGLEAMIHGAPLVSSNATCLPEIYGDSAHFFDPLNVDDIANKINDVLKDKNLRNELAAKGKKQVSKYSWRRMAEQTLAVYKSVLKS